MMAVALTWRNVSPEERVVYSHPASKGLAGRAMMSRGVLAMRRFIYTKSHECVLKESFQFLKIRNFAY